MSMDRLQAEIDGAGDLEPGRTYQHVYLVFVDAAGHSNVVRSNPRDRVNEAFDLLEEKVRDRFQRVARGRRCGYVRNWGWQGDGGLYIVWDSDESTASATALDASRSLIALDLNHLRDEFTQLKIRGELHLRVSVHRGTLTYLDAGRQGSIHSPDINLGAHLEKACPRDCVAITRSVYEVMSADQSQYHHVGVLEGEDVHLHGPGLTERRARARWLASAGMPNALPCTVLRQRPSPDDKAQLIAVAETDVIDLGTALRSCSSYLTTTARPRPYLDTVIELLERGVTYRCFLFWGSDEHPPVDPLDPSEDLYAKTRASFTRLREFKDSLPASIADNFQVYGMVHYPGMATLGVDVESPSDCMMLYSPYLAPVPTSDSISRGDLPHYLITTNSGPLHAVLRERVWAFLGAPDVERLL